ncbi:MAG: hypothetical protein A3E40_01965 [Candidatus Levybacteria bacterium RIFCSPHIGHO2_12_FULL_37_9]|nr:MAG: hypothetical protein A3E40_01965 [Candidatus Levybacteria bacterium RIFCSPHIGHO2_12_FULL_37_9]
MKNIKREYKITGILFTVVILILFWQFFLKGLYPYPGNYMLAWYEPWKTDNTKDQTITIAHKPVADDTFRYLYPFKKLGTDMLKKGTIPLWNPYNGAGMPLLATYQWAPLSPFNILFLLLESGLAWSFYIIIQAFLLSFFTYIYCRKINISIYGSVFSSIIFLFSGFVIARLVFGNLIYPLIALPILLYLVEDFVATPKKTKKVILIPIVITFMLVSGHPHIMAYVFIASVFYIFYRIFNIRKIIFIILLLLIGVGMAGIQLMPTIELFFHSNMTSESSVFIFNRFLLPPYHLINIFISNYFGNQSTYNYWGNGDYIETVAAIGLIPSFFTYISIVSKNQLTKKYRFFFMALAIVTILTTIDWFLTRLLFKLPIPIISTSPPSRIFVLTSFSLSILAGYGFDAWRNVLKLSRNLILKILPFIILVLAINITTFALYKFNIDCNNELIPNCRLIALRNTFLENLIFIPTIVLFFVYLKTNTKIIKKIITIVIIFLVLSFGIYNSNKFLPFSQKETLSPNHVIFDAIKKITNYDRVFGFGEANIKTNLATFLRFYDPQYYDPLYNKRYAELIGFSNTKNESLVLSRSDIEISNDINLNDKKNESRNRILNILGTKYFIYKKSENKNNKNIVWQDENWQISVNKNALPRAYLVSKFEVVKDNKKILEELFNPSFNPKTDLVLEEKPEISLSQKNSHPDLFIQKYSELEVIAKTNSSSNNMFVISDNFYPGWKAYVDDKETKIYRANYTFRAVALPAGKHIVRFSYKSNSFKIGIAISIFSIIIYIIIAVYINRFKKND